MEVKREGKKVGIYRSKLEQDWAMFFVECGIPFIHEPKYYGNWLPDFELTDCRALIEVKPTVEIADKEVPGKKEGMWLAYIENHDIVVLVGQPVLFAMYHNAFGLGLWNVAEFWDSTYLEDLDFIKNPEGYGYHGQGEFVQCVDCGGYYFIGLGSFKCRKCGYYDGDQTYKYPIYGKRIEDKYCRERPWPIYLTNSQIDIGVDF